MKALTIEDMPTESGIADLIALFGAKQLPKKMWTHNAHLTVALWYIKNFGKEKAICMLRSGIITYNESVGTVNSPYGGYHETLTLFWVWVIDNFVKRNTEAPFRELVSTFLKSVYSSRELPLRFYTKAKLFSVEARAVWVGPDLHDLDFLSIRKFGKEKTSVNPSPKPRDR